MTIGDRIKDLREQKDIPQIELAKRIQSSKQTLYKYENNIVTNIPSDKIEKLAKTLNVSPAYLMGWEDLDTESDDDIYYLDEGNKFMSKYPPEARKEIEVFLDYIDHKYNLK